MTRRRLILPMLILAAWLALPTAAYADTPTPTPSPTITQTPTATPIPLTNNLVSCWNFDETSGTRADSMGGNDLTDHNTVGSGTGVLDKAALFYKANYEYLSRANSSLPSGSTARSISVWYNQLNTAADEIPIFAYDDVNLFNGAYWGVNGCYDNTINLSSNHWYLLSVTYDGASTIKLYRNGSYIRTCTHSYNTASNATLYIYVQGYPLSNANDFMVDQSAVWSRELSAANMSQVYNGGSGLPCSSIGATATPTPTATFTPTPTPTASGQLQVNLTSGDWMTVKRETTYGDVAIVMVIGMALVLGILYLIVRLTRLWVR